MEALRERGRARPGWTLVALEQPHPGSSPDEQPDTSVGHRYAHSNVLIHHLIGNGRILSGADWSALFAAAGCTVVEQRPLDYLGYNAIVARLAPQPEDLRD